MVDFRETSQKVGKTDTARYNFMCKLVILLVQGSIFSNYKGYKHLKVLVQQWDGKRHTETNYFMILFLTQLWSSVGTPVLGLLEFSPAGQGSSFWGKSAYSEAPGAFSAGGGRRRNRSGCAGVPLPFQDFALTQGWLPLILIFVPASVVTVWHVAKSNSHVCCTCTSADETLTAKLLHTLNAQLSSASEDRLI